MNSFEPAAVASTLQESQHSLDSVHPHFLTVPVEFRHIIYHHASEDSVIVYVSFRANTNRVYESFHETFPHCSMLLVCKQVTKEAQRLYYQLSNVKLCGFCYHEDQLQHLSQLACQNLRSLEVPWKLIRLLTKCVRKWFLSLQAVLCSSRQRFGYPSNLDPRDGKEVM